MNRDLPEVKDLLLHRPPLLLLDRILALTDEGCIARAVVDPQAFYADGEGAMPAWLGLELMAQAISAYSGSRKAGIGVPLRIGYLLGTRSYRSIRPSFPAGTILVVEVRLHYFDEAGLSAFNCELRQQGETVAHATLKVAETA